MSLLLGIELTTADVVLTLVNRRGECVETLAEPLAQPVSDWWRVHPDEYFRAVERALSAAGRAALIDARVAGVGLAAEPALVLLDREHVPISPGELGWDQWLGDGDRTPGRALRRLAEERPALISRVGAVLSLVDHVRYRLTGTLATHVDFAWSLGLVRLPELETWQHRSIEELGLPAHAFPPIFTPDRRIGVVSEDIVNHAGISRGTWVNAGSDPLAAQLRVSAEPHEELRVALFTAAGAQCWRPTTQVTAAARPVASAGEVNWFEPAPDLVAAGPETVPADTGGLRVVIDSRDPDLVRGWPERVRGELHVAVDAGGPSAGPAIQAGLALGWWRDPRVLWRKGRRPVAYELWSEGRRSAANTPSSAGAIAASEG